MVENPRWHKADLHLHTRESDGIHHVGETFSRARAAGLQLVAITDHDEILRASETQERSGMVTLPGVEVTSAQGHVIGIFPDIVPLEIPMGYSLLDTIAMIHDGGGWVVIPHVGVGVPPISISPRALRSIYQRGEYVDAIETSHPIFDNRHARIAGRLAEELHIAPVGVSDDHEGNVGRRFITLVPVATGDPKSDLQVALRDRTTLAVSSELPLLSAPWSVPRHLGALVVGLQRKFANAPAFASAWLALAGDELREWRGDNGGK